MNTKATLYHLAIFQNQRLFHTKGYQCSNSFNALWYGYAKQLNLYIDCCFACDMTKDSCFYNYNLTTVKNEETFSYLPVCGTAQRQLDTPGQSTCNLLAKSVWLYQPVMACVGSKSCQYYYFKGKNAG